MRRLFRFARRSRGDIASDVDAELRFHLDERESELMARGMPADDAHAAALREFGDLDDARQYLRDVDHDIEMRRRRKDYMGEFTQDLGFAFRKLRSSPGFAAVAILTLALGIGANTAIFSVVNGVLLRPLPLPNPEQLVRVWWTDRANSDTRVPVSAVDLDDWRNRAPSVAGISGYFYADGTSGIDLTGGAEAQRLSAAFVELGFFTTLGAHAEAGRLPRPEELTRGGPIRVAVLSHGFWQRQFGGSRTVIDSAITLSGEPFTVIGVMPADFRYPSAKVDVYVPFATITDQMAPRVRTNRFMTAIARLQPGVTVARATTELGGVAQRLSASFVDDSAFSGVTMRSVQADMTLPVRSSLLVLFGAVGIVLLLACVNLASLQLARGTTRAHEMAVRLSLGATRGRIVRQLLTESLVVSLLGGVAGLGVGVLGTDSLLALAADQIPRAAEVRLDATVLAFAIGVSLATGVLFGLIPALRTSAAQPQVSLREGGRGGVGGGHRLRSALVVIEVALAVVLAAGATLMTKSFVRLLHVDAGFQPDHLVAANFTINTDHWTDSAGYRGFYHRVIERARTLPGVVSAGAAQYAPFQGMGELYPFLPDGWNVPAGSQWPKAYTQRVSDGYFQTIGTRVVAGREFTSEDRAGGPVQLVINETLAHRFFAGRDPIGRTISLGGNTHFAVIGVVADIRQSAIDEPAPSLIYVNNLQSPRVRTTLVVRVRGDPMAAARNLRAAIASMDPNQPVTSLFTFDDLMSDAVARPRALTTLLGIFGAVGLVLGALGIYGVLAYLVSLRRREIGVRIALGADRASVVGLVVRRGLALAGTGVLIGIPAAVGVGHLIRGVLYGVAPSDPATFALVGMALIVVALAASYFPARRAARVDPAIALRME